MTQLKLRHFVLPLIALTIIAALPEPAASGRDAPLCGPAAQHVRSAGMRAALGRFDAQQSAAAAKVCALHRNAN